MGEALIQTGAVKREEIERALQSQQNVRDRPLGTRLSSEGLVTVSELEEALSRQKSMPDRRIGETLVEAGIVTKPQIDDAVAAQRKDRKKPLGQLLVQLGFITQDDLENALTQKLGIPRVDLRKFYIDPESARLVSEKLVRDTCVLPICQFQNRVIVATDDPLDWEKLDQVSFAAKRGVDPVLARRDQIKRAIDLLYTAWVVDEAKLQDDQWADTVDDEDETVESEIADNLVVTMVNRIILNAYHEGASDVHVESGGPREKTRVRIRKDGVLRPFFELRPRIRRAVIARIKVMAGMDVTDRRLPQDGRIDLRRFSKTELELRVVTIPTVGGEEDVVMRLLAAAEPIPVTELGLSQANQVPLMNSLGRSHGLILVCGPTGSGKTTTLHAMLGELKSGERKIWTAEDPVEIAQDGLRQVHVNAEIGLTFARALRSFLRADPDVIMIGEMRDEETAGAAVEASLTGHLVLSTLHTNSAPERVARLLDLGLNPFNLADSLVAIIAQRLLRRLCVSCRKSVVDGDALARELLEEFQFDSGVSGAPLVSMEDWYARFAREGTLPLYRPVGCDACADTGYSGRLAIHEVMPNSPEIRRLVQHQATAQEIREAAQRFGMCTLKQDGIEKVLSGATDISEVRRVST